MPFLGWESPQDGRHILLGEPAVSKLRRLAVDGLIALPRRGIEVGGLLVGEARLGDIQIQTWEEVLCEHRYGPSYALSPADREALSALLAARPEGAPQVVGFFRSFTSRDPIIEEADEAFVGEHFPEGDFVYLMLQPLSPLECLATFRFFHDGQLVPETEDPPFAFDTSKMRAMQPRVEEPVAEGPVLEQNADRDGGQSAEPLLLPPSYRARMEVEDIHQATAPRSRWLVPALICLASVLAGALIYQTWTAPRELRWTDLRLDVRPVGGLLEVTWDPQVPRSLQASRGLLSVTNGAQRREILLNARQILTGKYSYSPSNGDVSLRLMLYKDDHGVAGEMARVSSIPSAPSPVVPPTLPSVADRTAAASAPPPAVGIAAPPSAVSEVQPTIPAGIRSRLTGQVVIPVQVKVNVQGAVVKADAERQGRDSLRNYLVDQARKAAMEWKFTPARSKAGTNVAGFKTIHFVFAP
jgi:hypothetical protein